VRASAIRVRQQHEDPVSISAVLAGFSFLAGECGRLAGNKRLVRTLRSSSRKKRPIMPVWLEVLLNLSGYAGFVALATRGAACSRESSEDTTYDTTYVGKR